MLSLRANDLDEFMMCLKLRDSVEIAMVAQRALDKARCVLRFSA
jgi:hypothetical protein